MTTPLRYDSVTMTCPICQTQFTPHGRRRYCSDACKQKAWRQQRTLPAPTRRPSTDTVYVCPECDTRYLGERRCPDCNLFTRRIGVGDACPHCGEPVAVSDLVP